MRVAFLGTSAFAVPALQALAGLHDVTLVVTQPDRPVGRHADIVPTAVKRAAAALSLPVVQPERVNRDEAVEQLRESRPDVLVVAAYGQLLRPALFTLAPLGAVNIHASVLPQYRGAAPVAWAIVRGETQTGITTFLIDQGMDTGPMLLTRSLDIAPDETAGELERRLADLGADAILTTLCGLEDGSLSARPQPASGASLAPRLTRDDGRVDWAQTALTVHNLVRGMTPWPGAWTLLAGERVKVHRTARTDIGVGASTPGTLAPRDAGRLLVACSDRYVEILEIQRAGRPRASGSEFLNGLRPGAVFG
jgi:methionyl-tRNA formyltransferase